MKRDKDLIRSLLLEIERSNRVDGLEFESRFSPHLSEGPSLIVFSLNGTEDRPELRSRDYQLIQMQRAGLIEFVDKQDNADFYGGRVRLTPVGHDVAEAIANDDYWSKLRVAAPKEAYDMVKNVVSSLAVTALSSIMGWG